MAREDVECRGSISARVSSDEGKEKKKKEREKRGKKKEREGRAKKKGVRTSDDFFGKHEFARRLMKKKGGKNNNFVARYTIMESRTDVMRNPAN